MMRASDYRAVARASLKGFWGTAIGIIVVMGLIVAAVQFAISMVLSLFSIPSLTSFVDIVDDMSYYGYYYAGAAWRVMLPMIIGAGLSGIIASAVSGVLALGQSQFFIDVVGRRSMPAFDTLFSRFSYFVNAFLLQLLMGIFTALWSMLFWFPGIVAMYRYSMAPWLMAQNPTLKPLEAIRMSKEMMRGHKGRLFCLHLSFIGWSFLASLTCGIGFLFLIPYMQAAEAAFYLERTGQINRDQVLYGTPNNAYGPAAGYPPTGGGYAPPPPQNPQGGYAPPPQGGYGAPQGGYGAPQGGYTAPQDGYGAPQGGYTAPQGGYATPGGYQPNQPQPGQPQPGYAPPQAPAAPPPQQPPQAPQGYAPPQAPAAPPPPSAQPGYGAPDTSYAPPPPPPPGTYPAHPTPPAGPATGDTAGDGTTPPAGE